MKNNVPHLLVNISGHGFGHVAQTAPILNRLREMLPQLRLTICSAAPRAILQSRISGSFEHIAHASDFGMVMASALDVLVDESFAAYQALHDDWPRQVAREAEFISALAPELVLTNVAYLPLAAATELGIPSASMCSLNWVDIFRHYCGDRPQSGEIIRQMQAAYTSAADFLRITPGMPMETFANLRRIGPIARLGHNLRAEVDHRLQLGAHEKLVLISLGGIASRLPMEHWPVIDGVRWLVQSDWQVQRTDTCALEALGMEFTDVLASCDAFLCKPGYGSFAEAACNGIPTLYVRRADWPEESCLTAWLHAHAASVEVSRLQLEAGDLALALKSLWAQPRPTPPRPTGIEEAANYLFRSISMASP